ncbi:hypothetical protein HK105_208966 [Polyrhizophydium stewartii]|uniref:Ankyrin repeat protein n=1 Tax=Polyrhizophydium stewartii TaxID=2732419 RepID=A0ABR4MWB0_9FUNG
MDNVTRLCTLHLEYPRATRIYFLLSMEHLNAIQIACILGDEEIAIDILDFVVRVTEEIDARKVLYEFMGRVWGNGNTVLHLASFLGMSDLVKRLLELGAAAGKINDRKYRPVDCADDDLTRSMFETVTELEPAKARAVPVTTAADVVIATPSQSAAGATSSSAAVDEFRGHGKSASWDNAGSTNRQRAGSASSMVASTSGAANGGSAGSIAAPGSAGGSSAGSPREGRTRRATRSGVSSSDFRLGELAREGSGAAVLDLCQHADAAPDRVAVVRDLLALDRPPAQRQVDPNALASPQQALTPLHLACSHGATDLVELLLRDAHVAVNVRDREGWTPLHCAAAEGHADIIRLLGRCQARFDPAVPSNAELDPDVFAVVDGPIDLVPLNADDETPEDIIFEERAEEISSIFLELKTKYPSPPQQFFDDLEADGEFDDEEGDASDDESDEQDERNAEAERADRLRPLPPSSKLGGSFNKIADGLSRAPSVMKSALRHKNSVEDPDRASADASAASAAVLAASGASQTGPRLGDARSLSASLSSINSAASGISPNSSFHRIGGQKSSSLTSLSQKLAAPAKPAGELAESRSAKTAPVLDPPQPSSNTKPSDATNPAPTADASLPSKQTSTPEPSPVQASKLPTASPVKAKEAMVATNAESPAAQEPKPPSASLAKAPSGGTPSRIPLSSMHPNGVSSFRWPLSDPNASTPQSGRSSARGSAESISTSSARPQRDPPVSSALATAAKYEAARSSQSSMTGDGLEWRKRSSEVGDHRPDDGAAIGGSVARLKERFNQPGTAVPVPSDAHAANPGSASAAPGIKLSGSRSGLDNIARRSLENIRTSGVTPVTLTQGSLVRSGSSSTSIAALSVPSEARRPSTGTTVSPPSAASAGRPPSGKPSLGAVAEGDKAQGTHASAPSPSTSPSKSGATTSSRPPTSTPARQAASARAGSMLPMPIATSASLDALSGSSDQGRAGLVTPSTAESAGTPTTPKSSTTDASPSRRMRRAGSVSRPADIVSRDSVRKFGNEALELVKSGEAHRRTTDLSRRASKSVRDPDSPLGRLAGSSPRDSASSTAGVSAGTVETLRRTFNKESAAPMPQPLSSHKPHTARRLGGYDGQAPTTRRPSSTIGGGSTSAAAAAAISQPRQALNVQQPGVIGDAGSSQDLAAVAAGTYEPQLRSAAGGSRDKLSAASKTTRVLAFAKKFDSTSS